jgi:hypothetical protein
VTAVSKREYKVRKKKTREKKKDGNSSSWAAEFKRITIMGI